MTSNHDRARDWLAFSFENMATALKLFETEQYPACVFRIQLSVESLVFLCGMQFKKTHELSRLLDSFPSSSEQSLEPEVAGKIRQISTLAKQVEGVGTASRYGAEVNGRLVLPSELFDEKSAREFFAVTSKITGLTAALLEGVEGFVEEANRLKVLLKKLRRFSSA
ncbi:MAG: hypothetical protein Kow0069_23920 [Promethearchaeota archaeon]